MRKARADEVEKYFAAKAKSSEDEKKLLAFLTKSNDASAANDVA